MQNNETGLKIKTLRQDHQMTQKQLGDLIGTSNKAISKWENGEGLPDIENLKRLSNVFNISIDQLINNHEVKVSHNILLLVLSSLTLFLSFLPMLHVDFFS